MHPLGQSAIPSAAFYLTRLNRQVPRLTMGQIPPEDPEYDYERQAERAAARKAAELAAGTETAAEIIAGLIPPTADPYAPAPGLEFAEPTPTAPPPAPLPDPPLAFVPTWAKVAAFGVVFFWLGRKALTA